MPHLSFTRTALAAALLLTVASLLAPALADEGGASLGSSSRLFNCKIPARDVDPAQLLLDLPGDADQMDGCGAGVFTGRKGVKVDLLLKIRDADGDSDNDSDTDRVVKRCRGRTDTSGQFTCTFTRDEFQTIQLNEPLESAEVEAVLNGGKRIDRVDLFTSCSAGSSTSPQR